MIFNFLAYMLTILFGSSVSLCLVHTVEFKYLFSDLRKIESMIIMVIVGHGMIASIYDY